MPGLDEALQHRLYSAMLTLLLWTVRYRRRAVKPAERRVTIRGPARGLIRDTGWEILGATGYWAELQGDSEAYCVYTLIYIFTAHRQPFALHGWWRGLCQALVSQQV